jgi:Peptidase C10 family/Secretion system C-terminal sorting domain/Spi protease inhibitor
LNKTNLLIEMNFMNKLIKYVSILALSVFTGVTSNAKSVDESTAKTVGANYLIAVGTQGVTGPSDLVTHYVASTTVEGRSITDYYVFNVKGGPGFVMVSADDIILPILASSSESVFNINNIAPAAKAWIDGYKYEITASILSNYVADPNNAKEWTDLIAGVPKQHAAAKTTSSFPSSTIHLLATTWDQAPGYNNSCPGAGVNKSVVGCVATAMAQVMKYWNWPSVGVGSHTYTQNPNPASYPAQTVDYAATAYNWTGMPTGSSNASVATLMYHAGVGVNMNYSPTESGSWVISLESLYLNCAEYAMKTYFHYKRSLRGVPRSGENGINWPNDPIIPAMTMADWITMLKGELDNNRPVIYSGSSITAGGHCWVCDGYDASNKMHFNWGWSGASDGWYTVNSLNPPALGIGGGGGNFNNDQCAIIGVQPDSFPSNPGNIKMNATLDCNTSSAMQYNSPFNFHTTLFNSNTTAFNGDVCAQVFDTSNNLVGTIQTLSGISIGAGAASAPLTFSTTGMLAMVPMDYYYVRVMYRATGSTTWTPAANNGTIINYNIIAVANSQIIRLADNIHPSATNIVRGTSFNCNTKIANESGSVDFTGTIQCVLVNVATGTSYPVQVYTGASIYYGSTGSYTFTLANVTAPSGKYILAIQHQPTGGTMTYTGSDVYLNPILVNVVGGVGIIDPSSNVANVQIYPNPANDVINIDLQGVSVNQITITDLQGRQVQSIIPGSQSVISVPLNNYAAGMYFVQLQSGAEVITKKIVVTK